MMRAFRPSRIVYSLLEELVVRKLNQLESGQGVAESKRSLCESELERRANLLADGFSDQVRTIRSEMTVGGGSLPDQSDPSWSVEIMADNGRNKRSAEKLLQVMRRWPLPVIGVIKHDRVQLNLATIEESEIPYLRSQLSEVLL